MTTLIPRAAWYPQYNRWQIKVTINGSRKSFYSSLPGRAGRAECEAKAAKWAEADATHDAKLSTVWDDFYRHNVACGHEASGIKVESYGRLYVKPVLGNRRLSTLRPRDWQRVIDMQYAAGLSKKTLTNLRGMMHTFVKWARKQEYLVGSVEVDIPCDAPRGERRVLSPDGIRAVFSADTVVKYGKPRREWYVYAYRFIIVNGLRRGECAGIREEDIRDGVLTIRRSISSTGAITEGKTANAQRRIGLSSVAAQIIEQQRRMKREAGVISPWLFCAENGDAMNTNTLYKEWRLHYAKGLGLDCSLHELRHTFISAVKTSMPLSLLQSIVGHSADTDSLGIYGHEYGDDLQQCARIVDSVFGQLTGNP